jgi:hypothetical protein
LDTEQFTKETTMHLNINSRRDLANHITDLMGEDGSDSATLVHLIESAGMEAI